VLPVVAVAVQSNFCVGAVAVPAAAMLAHIFRVIFMAQVFNSAALWYWHTPPIGLLLSAG
jgi:hypothetical protein